MYQMSGTVRPRCISFESSGFPLAVWRPSMTQLFEPGAQPSHVGSPSSASNARAVLHQTECRAGTALAWELSSSSSESFVPGGAGCGWLQSMTAPVGGRSRHDPTG